MTGKAKSANAESWGDASTRGPVAVIKLDDPPVNALSHSLRQRIAAELTIAEQDPRVRAIVLAGSDEFFSAGADVTEFNTPAAVAEPTLDSLIRRFEQCEKPTIAAISGNCLGGGFELALGCHFRLAVATARIGFPEVKLGLIPGAGGTQRLPRLAGLEMAVNMIVSGEPVPAAQLAPTPLFNRVVASDALTAACSFAGEIEDQRIPIRRIGDIRLNYPNHQAFLGFVRNMVKAKAGPYPAPIACVDAIEAGIEASDFEAGMRKEREIFLSLLQSPESHALRHVFFAERAAPRIADIPADTPTRPITSVAVIGAGTMGGGIAMNFLNAGVPVILLELNQPSLDRGIAAIRRNYESSASKGKLSRADLEARMALLRPSVSYDGLRDADLIIEAVFEDMAVKQSVFRQLDKVAKPDAILATNTSTLDVNTIAHVTSRPADVLGMHFFSPANIMRLLEVVRGKATAADALATVMQTAKKLRKLAVVSGVCDGFIGNRMLLPYLVQAFALLEEGCVPARVDRAIESFGFAMGPFRMSDLAGNDIGWAIRKQQYAENDKPAQAHVADRLCELGRFGQKTGGGWYDYLPGDRTPRPNADVDSMVVRHSEELGLVRRDIGDVEIVERLVYSLVNEGARVLEEKIAQRASDIDLVYLNGYGFPPWRGGPLFYADTVGLGEVVSAMRRYGRRYGRGVNSSPWIPAPLLDRLAAAGKTFGDAR